MKLSILLISIFLLTYLASCAPSESAIQTAIAATGSAGEVEIINTSIPEITRTPRPTRTITATITPKPSSTSKPTEIPTATKTNEEIEEVFRQGIIILLETMLVNDIENINLARIRDNILELEIKTQWASRDYQPDVSYKIVQYVAILAKQIIKDDNGWRQRFPDGVNLNLLTYSVNGDYPYQSLTDFETLLDVDNKKISYQEWVEASNAGFK